MQLYEYIAEADRLCMNAVEHDTKVKWLDRLEAMLREQLGDLVPEGTETVGVYPYDDVYVAYLKMKCAEAVNDVERFNNYLSLFNDARDALFGYYLRTRQTGKKVGWKNVL